eukprot:gene8089-8170_t
MKVRAMVAHAPGAPLPSPFSLNGRKVSAYSGVGSLAEQAIALLRCRAGLSRAEFIAYYETRHAPLIRSLFPEIIAYTRNYVDRSGAFDSAAAPIDFDSVTEMRFADRASYDRFLARAAEPDVARAIAEDEEHVFDRAATRMMVVDEVPASSGAAAPEAQITALEAERAVREGLARFARVIDAKDWAALTTKARASPR